MGGRYDIMQRIKEVLEASDPLKYGDAERSRTIEVGPGPQLSPDPRLAEYADAPATPIAPPPPPISAPPPPANAPAGQEELLALLREGRKLQAVKRYRELTGAGLTEAKAAVDTLEQRLGAPVAPPPAPPAVAPGPFAAPVAPDTDALAERVVSLVLQGNTIEAIKVYRAATGADLREAKEAVETIAARLDGAPAVAAPPPPPPTAPPPPPATVPPPPGGAVPAWLTPVVDQLRRGDKIGAIKAYRAATGVGLSEAKATVDALERQLSGRGYPH